MAGWLWRLRETQNRVLAEREGADAISDAWPWVLKERRANLHPLIRDAAEAHFAAKGIQWHRQAANGCSSQVACVNALFPLATRPEALSRVIARLVGLAAPPRMLRMEDGPDGSPFHVGFEWIGKTDHLGEWPTAGRPTRGANVTSADAAVAFEMAGRKEILLIEWKLAEAYGSPLDPRGNAVRTARYAPRLHPPEGPVRADLGLTVEDFYREPLYQLLRQTMLAHRMERAGEDGAGRVRLLHVSPEGNLRLKRVTAPALAPHGATAVEAMRATLDEPERLIAAGYAPLLDAIAAEAARDPALADWSACLHERYAGAVKA